MNPPDIYSRWARQVHAPKVYDVIKTVFGFRILLDGGCVVDVLTGAYGACDIISVYDASMVCRGSWHEGNPITPVDWLGIMVGGVYD